MSMVKKIFPLLKIQILYFIPHKKIFHFLALVLTDPKNKSNAKLRLTPKVPPFPKK